MVIRERETSQELEKRSNIGVGLIIINPQGQIWTNVELIGKESTTRNAGEVSIPTEQVKEDEGFWENVKGGLGEFCSDKDIPLLRENLFTTGLPKVVEVNSDKWKVACSLVTVVCNVNINPTPATNEVTPHRWMNIEEALGLPNLRSFSRQLLEIAKRDDLVKNVLSQRNGRSPILREFGNGVSFNEFIQKRDLLSDRFKSTTAEILPVKETLQSFPAKVLIAQPHGLCAGVVRSIRAYEDAITTTRTGDPKANIYSLGEPAHNTFVNDGFRQQGVVFINSPKEAPERSTILLGAHGTEPSVREAMIQRGQKMIDTVCPLVTRTHTEARRWLQEDPDITIIYFGKDGHQEAKALLGESRREGDILLVERLENLEEISRKVRDPKKVAFLSQTTHPASKAEEIRQALLKQFPNLKYPLHTDTCYATQNRQDAVRDMVRKGAQTVVIVGSATSSNSKELQNVAIESGAKGVFVDSADALKVSQFVGIEIVGLTSGASVPEETFLETAQWFMRNGSTEFVPVFTVDERRIRFAPVKMEI